VYRLTERRFVLFFWR